MTIITRADGVKFSIDNYREILVQKKTGLLKKEMRQLAQNHGLFAKFYYRPNQQIEGIFSQEEGYLLGEAVWNFFNRPANLIFCESLPKSPNALLVIVKDNNIYLATELAKSTIPNELAPLLGTGLKFDIYINGDLPLSETPENNKFAFDKTNIHIFNVLAEPLFSRLPVSADILLLPIEDAIAALHLPSPTTLPIILFVVTLILFGFGWKMLLKPPPQAVAPPDPFAKAKEILTSPSPDKVLTHIAENVEKLYLLPGFKVETLKYANGKLTATLSNLGGKTTELLDYARTQNFRVDILPNAITLDVPLPLHARHPKIGNFQNLNDAYASLVDSLARLVPYPTIVLKQTTNNNYYRVNDITLTLRQCSPTVLREIAKIMAHLPINVVSGTLQISNGLISGTFNMEMFGI